MTAAAPRPGWSSSAPGAAPAGRPDGALAAVRAAYAELFGTVPAGIEHRLALAGRAGRTDSVLAIEALRQALIMDNPLGIAATTAPSSSSLSCDSPPSRARPASCAARAGLT